MTLSFIRVGEGFTSPSMKRGVGTLASPLGARDSHSPSMERGVGTLASPLGARDLHSPSMERGVG